MRVKVFLVNSIFLSILFFGFSGCASSQSPSINSAAWGNNFSKLKKEVELGKNINATNSRGLTALDGAIYHNNVEMVKYLVEHGANVNKIDKYFQPILFRAIAKENLEIVKYLVEHGASLISKDRHHKSPINYAIFHLSYSKKYNKNYNEKEGVKNIYKIIKYFVDKGVDLNIKDNQKRIALDRAIEYGNPNIINFIERKMGMSVDVVEKEYIDEDQEKKLKIDIAKLEKNNDFKGLKEYTDKYPNSVYFISDPSMRLALTGPKGLKVGDIRKHLKDGRSETIVIALIKRVKEPYKEFTLDEIDTLAKMGLSDNIIASMINVTTKILENNEKRKQQELLLSEQKKIAGQKTKVIYKESSTKTNGKTVGDKVQDELINQGVNKLLDHLF